VSGRDGRHWRTRVLDVKRLLKLYNIPSKFICFSQIICKFAHRLLVNKYMRNFLIHGYHNVEKDLVWEAIAVDLQHIREKIVKYLEGFDK